MKLAFRDVLVILGVMLAFVLLVDQFSPASSGATLTDALGRAFSMPSSALMSTGTGFGVLLLGAWLIGRAAASIKLPKITGYLLFGIVVGPNTAPMVVEALNAMFGLTIDPKSAPTIIGKDELDYLKLVNDLAIALIALTAGSEIHLDFVKRMAKTILSVLILQVILIMGAYLY